MDFIPKPKKLKAFGSSGDEDADDNERPQDPLVASVMEEDQARKQAKKGDRPAGGKKKKKAGLTLEQVEELEGGVIKESKTGMAATTRADKRKRQGEADETGMLPVGDLRGVEERLELGEDDGMTLEPFNLVKEREEGSFDEAGNYVENRRDDDEEAQDAWLASDEANVLSDEMRQKVEAQKARMASAEEAPTITPRETADLMRQLIEILQPRENVTRALKRLRPVRPKENAGKKKSGLPTKAEKSGEEEPESAALFERLTEASSTLMDAGELDVYSTSREEFEAKASKYPAADEDFDMFGDDPAQSKGMTSKPEERNGQASTNGQPRPQQQSQKPPSVQPGVASEAVDYSIWPVKELARFLKERGEDPSGIVEKAELVKKVAEVAAKGPEGDQPQVPLGYAFDPSSTYYYNPEAGMYYDTQSGSYFSATDGQWYRFDDKSDSFVKLT